jgi:S-adenosylmethionine hydrolase
MKGVMLAIAPDLTIVDLTHEVPPQDVLAGALHLRAATPYFPPRTIHVAVVDPGVGTARRLVLVETRRAFFVVPDNGLASLAAPAADVMRVVDVSRSRHRLPAPNATFHGRDVLAPVAARLAAGIAPPRLGRAAGRRLVRLRLPAVVRRAGTLRGEVIAHDRFGNLTTNVGRAALAGFGAFRGRRVSVTIGDHVLRLRRTYGAVPAGHAVALVNSAGFLEIAVNRGSAAELLAAGRGTGVVVRPS